MLRRALPSQKMINFSSPIIFFMARMTHSFIIRNIIIFSRKICPLIEFVFICSSTNSTSFRRTKFAFYSLMKSSIFGFFSFPIWMIFPKWKSISIFWFRIAFLKFRFGMIPNLKSTFVWMNFLIDFATFRRTKFSNIESFSFSGFFKKFFRTSNASFSHV